MPEAKSQTAHQVKPEVSRPPRPGKEEPARALAARPERGGELQLFREFDHAILGMERRMDRAMREILGEGRSPLGFPLLQGLALQPGPDGSLRFQPFGHLQEALAEGWRDPVLTWRSTDDGKGIEFRAEVPGIKKDDIDVEVRPEGLLIEGEGEHAKYAAQCSPGFRLDPESAEARYEDGLLTVNCRVAEPATKQGRKLPIR